MSYYMKRKEEKKNIYSKHKLELIEIYPDDLKNLDHVMRLKLRSKGIIE